VKIHWISDSHWFKFRVNLWNLECLNILLLRNIAVKSERPTAWSVLKTWHKTGVVHRMPALPALPAPLSAWARALARALARERLPVTVITLSGELLWHPPTNVWQHVMCSDAILKKELPCYPYNPLPLIHSSLDIFFSFSFDSFTFSIHTISIFCVNSINTSLLQSPGTFINTTYPSTTFKTEYWCKKDLNKYFLSNLWTNQ